MTDPMLDVYSPENIARSRARARGIREAVENGELEPEWLVTAAQVEAYADVREREAAARNTGERP